MTEKKENKINNNSSEGNMPSEKGKGDIRIVFEDGKSYVVDKDKTIKIVDFSEKDSPKLALYDKEFYATAPVIFNRRLTSDQKQEIETEDGKKLIIYTANIGVKKIEYQILKVIEDELGGTPSLFRKGRDVLTASVGIAFEQKAVVIGFQAHRILRTLGHTDKQIKAGGKIYNDLDKTIKSLAYTSYKIINQKRGSKHKEIIGHLFDIVKVEGEGRGKKYFIKLNELTVLSALPYILGEETKKRGEYVAYPLSLLANKELTNHEKSGMDYLVGLRGLGRKYYGIKIENLLRQKMGVREDIMKRPNECLDILNNFLIKAQKLNLIEGKELDYNGTKDIRKWQVKFLLPQRKELKERNRQTATYQATQEASGKSIDDMVEWLCRPIFNIRTSQEDVKKMLTNTINKFGYDKVLAIYNEEGNATNAHPKNFWNRIRELKNTN